MFWKKKEEVKKTKSVDQLTVYFKEKYQSYIQWEHDAKGVRASFLGFNKSFFLWYFTKKSDSFTVRHINGETVMVRSEISRIECNRREVPCED